MCSDNSNSHTFIYTKNRFTISNMPILLQSRNMFPGTPYIFCGPGFRKPGLARPDTFSWIFMSWHIAYSDAIGICFLHMVRYSMSFQKIHSVLTMPA